MPLETGAVVTGVLIAGKVASLCVGSYTIYTVLRDRDEYSTWQLVHRVGTNALFLVAGTLTGVGALAHWAPNVVIALEVTSGALNLATKVSRIACKPRWEWNLDDALDILGCLSFRIAAVTAQILILYPSLPEDTRKLVGGIQDGAFTARGITDCIQNREKLTRTATTLMKLIYHWCTKAKILAKINEFNLELAVDPETRRVTQEVLSIEDISQCSRIPELLVPCFTDYLCKITRTPIRYIVVVEGTEHLPNPVVYERQTLLDYMEQHPGETPPGWPEDLIPFTQDKIVAYPPAQRSIDTNLAQFILEIRRDMQNVDLTEHPHYTILRLARQMQSDSRNKDIADFLIKNLPAGCTTSSIEVNHVSYSFSNRQEEPAIQVTVGSGAPPISLGEAYLSACALLGSEDSHHKEILQQTLRYKGSFSFYFSQNFNRLHFQGDLDALKHRSQILRLAREMRINTLRDKHLVDLLVQNLPREYFKEINVTKVQHSFSGEEKRARKITFQAGSPKTSLEDIYRATCSLLGSKDLENTEALQKTLQKSKGLVTLYIPEDLRDLQLDFINDVKIKIPNQEPPHSIILRLARQLQFGRANLRNKNLVDVLSRNIPTGYSPAIDASTTYHSFAGEEKQAIQISVGFGTNSSPVSQEMKHLSACALLGSKDPHHQKVFQQTLKYSGAFTFYLAQDLTSLHFQGDLDTQEYRSQMLRLAREMRVENLRNKTFNDRLIQNLPKGYAPKIHVITVPFVFSGGEQEARKITFQAGSSTALLETIYRAACALLGSEDLENKKALQRALRKGQGAFTMYLSQNLEEIHFESKVI